VRLRVIAPLSRVTVPRLRVIEPLLVACAVLGAGVAIHAAGLARAGATPAEYLLAAQGRDGGFGGAPGQSSSQLFSGWAALGLAAEGYNPQHVAKSGHSLSGFLSSGVATDTDPGSIERTILAVAASGLDSASFAGHDLVAALERDVGGDGSVSGQTNLTSFAVLALRAAGVSPRASTLSWLIRQEDQDGGFNFATAGAVSDVDDTGAALEALAGVPGSAAAGARTRAAAFVKHQQDPDGGFPSSAGAGSNAQSTAWAVQGLLAAGVTGARVNRAISYLESLIAPDGHVRYSRSSEQTPVWVTAQAAMALAEKPLPLPPVVSRSAAPKPRRVTAAAPTRRRGHGQKHARAIRAPHRRPRTATPSVTPSPMTRRLATDMGILEALALAPIGGG
jgi:energy-coupling factor transport system substrate-specific component